MGSVDWGLLDLDGRVGTNAPDRTDNVAFVSGLVRPLVSFLSVFYLPTYFRPSCPTPLNPVHTTPTTPLL